ncbi:MAG: hypothetical protein QOH91_1685 [Mycobacterium sp.]|nr:hypothetical protein [Mycobacterium sp.]
MAREIGVHAEAVDPAIEAIVGQDWLARNALGVLKMSIDVLCRRAVIEVDDLRRAITRVQPDVVIVDANCWGAMSVADASSVGWLLFRRSRPTCDRGRHRHSGQVCDHFPVLSAASAMRPCGRSSDICSTVQWFRESTPFARR